MAPPVLAVHGALSRGVLAVTVLVSLAVLFTPGDDVPSAPAGVDKLVHLLVFAAAHREWRDERFRPLYLPTTREHRGEVSVLVGDLEGFTGFTAARDAAEVAAMLRAYFERAAPLISRRFGGEVEKFFAFAPPKPGRDVEQVGESEARYRFIRRPVDPPPEGQRAAEGQVWVERNPLVHQPDCAMARDLSGEGPQQSCQDA